MKNLLVLGGLAAVFAVALVMVVVFNNNQKPISSQANLMALNTVVVFDVAVNDYPDHQNYNLSENQSNAYVNVYNIGVEDGYYTTTYKETVWTGYDTTAEIEVGLGEIVNFKGFLTEEEALASINSVINTVPYKNFGDDGVNTLCQINYYEEDEYLNNSETYACATSLSIPYSNADVGVYVYDYWWNYLDQDEFTYSDCMEIKDLWDVGNWTANYGTDYAPGVCADQYAEDWYSYSDSDYYWECDYYGNCWDSDGNNWYDSAYDTYLDTYWFNNIGENDFTYWQCYEIKQMWDLGNWTANYGSTYAPSACSMLYVDDWYTWSNNSGNVPPAGYEDEVYTVYTENPFPDTDISTLEGTAAAYLYNIGVLGGFPDGEFKGDREVNRAEICKFLLLAAYGSVGDADNNGQFSDVLDGQWYTKFVVTAADLGIVSGYSDGTFKPANTVNTAEFLKMLSNTFGLSLWMDHNYNDVPVDAWFAQYAGVAEYYNLFPDRGNYLEPASLLTREEVAVALYQYLTYNLYY